MVERDRLGAELGRLPIDQRAVMVLHFYLDLPLTEAADILDIPIGTAKSRLHRGLETLRTAMAATAEPVDLRSGATGMSTRVPLERMVAAWMADEAVVRGAVTDQLVDQILSTTGRQRPRPRWLALLKESPMTAQARVAVGSPTGRLAFAVVLIVLAAVAVIGVGAAILLRPQPMPDDWTGFRGGPGHTGLAPSGPMGNPVVRWRVDLGAPVRTDLAVVGDLVIAPSDNGVLHALSIADGSERWSFRPGTSMTGPTVANGAVYVTDGTGAVRAVDLATGAERWRSTTPINGATSSVAADGAFFVGTGDGQIQSLELASGVQRWRATVSTDGQPAGAPAYADGMVYAGTTQGSWPSVRQRVTLSGASTWAGTRSARSSLRTASRTSARGLTWRAAICGRLTPRPASSCGWSTKG